MSTIARGILAASHSAHTTRVAPPTPGGPSAAEITNSAASAARSPARSSPTKSA
ncbi:Uncharacterised protein [Mycobacteroides abscessus subsp. abscessus]|nr:Uncharacterised protein [Mycobacteroides abscessus subsp. abscessus]